VLAAWSLTQPPHSKEDYDKAKAQAADAVRSRAYLYPFKGIAYFFTHQSLWKPFKTRITPILGLSVSVVTGMFLLTYLPQLAVSVFISGPLAVFTTMILVLNESSAIISMVSRNFILKDAIVDTFDGTLLSRNESEIVSEGRQIKSGGDPMEKLGKLIKNPLDKFSPQAAIRYVLYLPLNFIPGKIDRLPYRALACSP
jgi:hypothetical protein